MARYISKFSLQSAVTGGWKVGASGRILNPGRYEGEPAYMPYFHEQALCGCACEDAYGDWYFDITKQDVELFPELQGVRRLYVLQDDNGFVYHKAETHNTLRVL